MSLDSLVRSVYKIRSSGIVIETEEKADLNITIIKGDFRQCGTMRMEILTNDWRIIQQRVDLRLSKEFSTAKTVAEVLLATNDFKYLVDQLYLCTMFGNDESSLIASYATQTALEYIIPPKVLIEALIDVQDQTVSSH